MIYSFTADYSGVVIAEDKESNLENYLGLNYPAFDVPNQARQIYHKNRLRIIPDVNYKPVKIIPSNHPLSNEPLDLSCAILNSSLSQAAQENVDIISRSGEHLLSLINDVLEISKIEAGKPTLNETYFELYRLIYSIQEMFALKAADKGINLITEFGVEVNKYMFGDEGKLKQILINLIGNAIRCWSCCYQGILSSKLRTFSCNK
jgi:light-regulated signal transduction histidine kinase (bacteriophytochrome)